jgi:amidohydrolase
VSRIGIGRNISAEVLAEAVSWRHDIHKHPELGYTEKRTSDLVAAQLTRFEFKVHRGLGGTGVVGTLTRGTSRRVIGIRADMDALPIEEQSGALHTSVNHGTMHACGHDGHVAIALAAARVCANLPDLDGTVHFIFQPAEEGLGGSRRMIEDGLFRLFPCDSIDALHNWPMLPLGTCVARDGPMMAAIAMFEIEIAGRGCHGAMPHEGSDCVLAAAHLITALQSIVSRNVDSSKAAVVSATQLSAGEAWNVIPDRCVIRGTTRWFDEASGNILRTRLRDLAQSIATGFGCQARIKYEDLFPATINDPAVASVVREVARDPSVNLNVMDAAPSTAAEDFSVMLQSAPGCYLWLGGGKNGDGYGLHSPHYDFNDDLLPYGVALWVALVRKCLGAS